MSVLDCWRADCDGWLGIGQWDNSVPAFLVGELWRDAGTTPQLAKSNPNARAAVAVADGLEPRLWLRDRVRCSLEFLTFASPAGDPLGIDTGFAFDFCIVGRDEVHVLIKRIDRILVWSIRHRHDADDGFMRVSADRVAEIPILFRSSFRAYFCDDAYYFLTEEGTFYRARKKSGAWSCGLVRPPGRLATVAILTDKTTHRASAFGRDFWFALDEKLTPDRLPEIRCRDVTLGHPELGQPLRTVANCADVLHEAGVLTPPPAEAEVPQR